MTIERFALQQSNTARSPEQACCCRPAVRVLRTLWARAPRELASLAATILTVGVAQAQATADELVRVDGREYVRLCSSSENANPCLGAVYAGAAVNRLLDAIGDRRTFCPPPDDRFPPPDVIARLSAWLKAHPALLDKPAHDGISRALKDIYPCR